MSQYPESLDVFTPKTGSDNIASSDPNNAFDGVEAVEGLVGALGKPQSWSATLLNALRNYQQGMRIEVAADVLYVRAGEAVLVNTDGSKFVFRRNAADVTIAAGHLDAGTLVVGTYFVYATGDGAATTAPIVFSTDYYAPSGIGTAPYRKLGIFQNAAAGALTPTYAWSELNEASFQEWKTGATVAGTFVKDTVYQAQTGGSVVAYIIAANASNTIEGYCDAVDGTTKRADAGGGSYSEGDTITFPVPKKWYWKIACNRTAVIHWIPYS